MNEEDVKHFVQLARQGRRWGASSGERQARALALAIVENAPGLDMSAIEGAVEFMRRAPMAPSTARDLVFANVPAEKAAVGS